MLNTERMKPDYTLSCVGASDEETAHLRLLLRSLNARLPQRWVWTEPESARVLICDIQTNEGQKAQRLASQRNQLCILLSQTELHDELSLTRPLNSSLLFKTLQVASRQLTGLPSGITQGIGNFFDHLEQQDHSWKAFVVEGLIDNIPDARTMEPTVSIEQASSVDALSDAPSKTTVPTSEVDSSISVVKPEQPDLQISNAAAVIQKAAYPLWDYLTKKLIGVPSQIALPGAPSLILIPANRTYFSLGKLSALDPYFNTLLPRTEWKALTPGLLTQIRSSPCNSYDLMLWHKAFTDSNGKLAAHLDPGAYYQLTQTLDLTADHPRAHRIGLAMSRPTRLHQIATESGTSVAEVYAVISAFDVIGYLKWHTKDKS